MIDGCVNCRYSRVDHEPDQGFDDGPLLRCHRYPPTLVVIDGEPAQILPDVRADDWCGEYRQPLPGGD